MKSLVLYSTSGCHLCDDAKALVLPLLSEFQLGFLEVDIVNSQKLIDLYGVRIPVVKIEESNADLGWPFESSQLRKYLSSYS
jgi:thiol-disulfide isomerase/thioredoxin